MERAVNESRVTALEASVHRALAGATITEKALDLCPEVRLHLMGSGNMQRRFSAEETRAILAHPPYWALCWASGQALAWHVLRNKSLVRGKRILDFGAGSGVVAIAAAMGGAARVIACDHDPDAIAAIRANAALNKVQVETCRSLDDLSVEIDLILAADVFYDRENYYFLHKFLELAPEILVADSRIKVIEVSPYRRVTEITTSTIPDLDEYDEFKRVGIYRAFTGKHVNLWQYCKEEACSYKELLAQSGDSM